MLEILAVGGKVDILGGGSDQNIVGGLDGGVFGAAALVHGDELLTDDENVALAVVGGVDGIDTLDDLGDEELGELTLTGGQGGLAAISRKSWLFLILSGLATGVSWLCYYRALQLGTVSRVAAVDKLSVLITMALAFVFLHERFTAKSLLGCALIGAGTLLMVL